MVRLLRISISALPLLKKLKYLHIVNINYKMQGYFEGFTTKGSRYYKNKADLIWGNSLLRRLIFEIE
jgi:hypothetical protein